MASTRRELVLSTDRPMEVRFKLSERYLNELRCSFGYGDRLITKLEHACCMYIALMQYMTEPPSPVEVLQTYKAGQTKIRDLANWVDLLDAHMEHLLSSSIKRSGSFDLKSTRKTLEALQDAVNAVSEDAQSAIGKHPKGPRPKLFYDEKLARLVSKALSDSRIELDRTPKGHFVRTLGVLFEATNQPRGPKAIIRMLQKVNIPAV